MKRSEFPEKAYETMFIHELLTLFTKPGSTPFYIPSQVVEKRLGYDLCFVDSSGNPLNRKVMLIQFKVSEQYANGGPHKKYKFEIYEGRAVGNKFLQHNKLCRYNTYGSQIVGVYSAPRFVSYKDFYKKVQTSCVIADSEFFPPLRREYSGHHYVTFEKGDAYQHSKEATKIKMVSFEELLQTIKPINKEQFESFLEIDKERAKKDFQLLEGNDESDDVNDLKIKDGDALYCGGQYFLFI